MWDLIHCYLSGRHDYGMWCESGEMFLRCVHCGKRSSGWAVEVKYRKTAPLLAGHKTMPAAPARVIPFDRALAGEERKSAPYQPAT
ncbi:MAG: hypothetical protein ACRD2I_02110 [Vicinamibacterales bacterium]